MKPEAEHAVLQSVGVDAGQGRLFGRPGPADLLVEEGTRLAARRRSPPRWAGRDRAPGVTWIGPGRSP